MEKFILPILKFFVTVAISSIVTYYIFIHKNPIVKVNGRIDSVAYVVQSIQTDAHLRQNNYLKNRHDDSVKIVFYKNEIMLERFHRQHYQSKLDSLMKHKPMNVPNNIIIPIWKKND